MNAFPFHRNILILYSTAMRHRQTSSRRNMPPYILWRCHSGFFTSPRPKHWPISWSGLQVSVLQAFLRRSSRLNPFVSPCGLRNWPFHLWGGWSEHHPDGPSFSIPSRTSLPWRHPTSSLNCHETHSELAQQLDAHEESVVASLYGFRSPGHFPWRFSFSFHGVEGHRGICNACCWNVFGFVDVLDHPTIIPKGGRRNTDSINAVAAITIFFPLHAIHLCSVFGLKLDGLSLCLAGFCHFIIVRYTLRELTAFHISPADELDSLRFAIKKC